MNKEKVADYKKNYYTENEIKIKKYRKEYIKKNKEKINKQLQKRKKIRRQTDPLYIVSERYSDAVRSSLKRKNYTKKSSAYLMLGCSYDDFVRHLNNNPYGFTVDDLNLDLDHINPVSSAKNKDELYKLHHYSNFQLLPREYNQSIKKDNKWNKNHFELWLKAQI